MFTIKEKNDIFNLVKDRFNRIFPSDCFNEDEHDSCDEFAEDHWYNLCDIVEANDICFGASKLVFFFDFIPNYVIKIPIIGSYDYEIQEYRVFENAHPEVEYVWPHDTCDYCGLEADIYSFVCKTNINLIQFFAGTEYIGTTESGIPLYLSEKMTPLHYDSFSSMQLSQDSAKKANLVKNTYGRLGGISEKALSVFYECYKETDIDNLITFIYDYGIDDLHSSNLGLNSENKIVFLDYSGFDN